MPEILADQTERPSEEEILEALERAISSPAVGPSGRAAALLRYVVTEALAGRADRIKAMAIAMDVLGRSEDFDPNSDSAVRVEAKRLREALAHYYRTDGMNDPVVIDIPKGQYVPVFRRRPASGSPNRRGRTAAVAGAFVALALTAGFTLWQAGPLGSAPGKIDETVIVLEDGDTLRLPEFQGPRIAVYPFRAATLDEDTSVIAYGVTLDTIGELSRFDWLGVFVGSSRRFGLPDGDPDVKIDYALSGDVRLYASEVVVRARLTDGKSGQIHWSRTYRTSRDAAGLVQLEQSIATAIALEIGRAGGTVERLERRRVFRDTTLSTSAYGCVLHAYHYWRSFRPEKHARVRGCLEQAVKEAPTYAEAHAALALMYLDEHRYGLNARPNYDALELAGKHAERAFDLNSFSTLAAQALFTVLDERRDRIAFLAAGEEALRNSPNNPDLLADFGNKVALDLGNWDAGIELVERAIAFNPDAPGWYYIALAFGSYLEGRHEQAIYWSERMNLPDFVLYHLVRLAAFNRQGDRERAEMAMNGLARVGYGNSTDVLGFVTGSALDGALAKRLEEDITSAYRERDASL